MEPAAVCQAMDDWALRHGAPACVIDGFCRGVDEVAHQHARDRGWACERFPADWNEHGKSAGPIRNAKMVSKADALLAIRAPGESRGTDGICAMARMAGLLAEVVHVRRSRD